MNILLETPDALVDRVHVQDPGTLAHHATPATVDGLVGDNMFVFRRYFSPLLPPHKDAAILDIGRGYGDFLYFLQESGYLNAQGIDLNAREVEVGNSLGVRNIRCGDSRDFMAQSCESFDFISAINVLDHIPSGQILDFLGQVRSVLAPGGTFLCQVPNLAAFFMPNFHTNFSHESPFTAASLNRVLELAGFSGVKVSAMSPVIHGAQSAIRRFFWMGISGGLRFIKTLEGGSHDPLDSIYTATIFATARKS